MLRLSSEQDAAHKGSTTGGVPAGGTSQSHSQCLWQPCHSASRSSGNEPRDATVKADQQSFFVSEACDGGAGWTIEKSKANGSSYKPRINKSAGLFLFGRVGSIIGPPLFLMRLLVIDYSQDNCGMLELGIFWLTQSLLLAGQLLGWRTNNLVMN